MTDRFSGFVVALERNLRDDDAQGTIEAIRMIKGVVDVQPIIAEPGAEVEAMRIKIELRDKLFLLIKSL